MSNEKSAPEYLYDEKLGIQLPPEVEQEIKAMVKVGHKIQAVLKVLNLTKAGLKISKDYVDGLTSE